MPYMDILTLLQSAENKTLEFKRDLSSPEGMLRTLVAFANTAGGILLIGVEDKTRQIQGVQDPLLLEERIANLVSDKIQPKLIPDIEILPYRNMYILAVQVHLSSSRPHFLKERGLEKGVFIRVGSTNRQADAILVRELQRAINHDTFDEYPLPEFNTEAINFRVASELFAPDRKLKSTDLETLRITTKHQGRLVPTIGGMILFGQREDCMSCFPDAWIQCGRFGGTNKQLIKNSQKIFDYPARAVEEAMAFIGNHCMVSMEFNHLHHAERWKIPQIAVREAIINAVVHTDYSQKGSPIRIAIFDDRLEIENPGLLLTGLTINDLQNGVSKLRNRVVARVFHELKLIEQWGSGIQRMIAACKDAGLTEPILEEIGTHFRVTIHFAQEGNMPLINDDINQSILSLLEKRPGLSTQQIAVEINLSARATRTRVSSLIKRGIVIPVGTSPKDPKRKFFLTK